MISEAPPSAQFNKKYLVVSAVVIIVALGLVLFLRNSSFQNKLNELLDMNIVNTEGKLAVIHQSNVPWENWPDRWKQYSPLPCEFREVNSWITFKSLAKTNKINVWVSYDPNARVIWFDFIETDFSDIRSPVWLSVTYYYKVPDF